MSDVKMNGNEATKQPPPPPANNNNANNNNNTLLSHILPPSHILDDGRFIQLPPPTTLEKSTFFERAVASRQLIANDNDTGIQRRQKKKAKSTKKKKRSCEEEVDDAASTTSSIISNTKRRKKKKSKTIDTQQQYIHPLAMASAKLQSNGINELSKAINLNTLVIGNEYFGLSNIVNSQTPSGVGKMIDNMDNKSNMNNGEGATTHSNNIQSTIDETIQKDQNLRTSYTLQNRHEQYKHTSTVLSRHSKRLSKSISIMQTIDNKLFTLRKQWKLCAPEHGVRTVGPVRSKEVIAVDVDVYNNNRIIHPSSSTSTATTSSQLGRIARRVPRYATIEIDDEYNMMSDIKSLRKKVKNVLVNLKKVTDDDDDDTLLPASTSSMELEEPQTKLKEPTTTMSKTKAEPFAIADPTIGKIDHDFDPNKVPLLTLLFSIEKSCTGFVEFATLSSSFQSKSNDDNGENTAKESQKEQSPDERVIEALQHSLFCASLFESMRSEIIQPTSSTASQQQQQQRQQKSSSSIAWLSSEMEESFLPPPTSMAGGDSSSSSQLLCVVHCHEGEVKVQLDDEYSLTVKLIEAGTAAGCAGKAKSSLEEASTTATSTTKQSDTADSGSQSPTRLKTLCRALLLHSQSLYHTHCMKTRKDNEKKKEDDKPVTLGFARTKKEVQEPSPHILQQCVSLGCKFIIEKKIRLVLKASCMFSFNVDIV